MRPMIAPPIYQNAETLIIERELHLRRIVQQYLRQAGIRRISEADDAESALNCIRKTRIELLIADWNCLIENDEFLMQNIRNWANVRGRFAFAVMIGEARESHILHAINNGVDTIVSKPFSASGFWTHIGHALEARRLRQLQVQTAKTG